MRLVREALEWILILVCVALAFVWALFDRAWGVALWIWTGSAWGNWRRRL